MGKINKVIFEKVVFGNCESESLLSKDAFFFNFYNIFQLRDSLKFLNIWQTHHFYN